MLNTEQSGFWCFSQYFRFSPEHEIVAGSTSCHVDSQGGRDLQMKEKKA